MISATGVDKPLHGVRVLFVLPSLGLGGAERQAFLFARHLLRNEHADVHLLGLGASASLAERCIAEHIPCSSLHLQHGYRDRIGQLQDLLRFIRFLRRHRTQILLPYCMFQNVLCALTWEAGGARVCIWNQRDEGRSRLDRWIEWLAVSRVRRFVSNSQHGADFLTASLHVAASRVDVVPNGLELPTRGPAAIDWRQACGIPPNAFVACMVANLHGEKDHKTLVAAWRSVVDRWKISRPPHLLLAGAFRERYQALLAQVQSLGLERHVHFLGEVREVDDLDRAIDLCVFSSFKEGIPNAILEAMAHERAVVATDYPGIREAVGVEGASLLASARDPQALADKILCAAADDELRARLGRSGRERVRDVFGVDVMAERMTKIVCSEWLRNRGRALGSSGSKGL